MAATSRIVSPIKAARSTFWTKTDENVPSEYHVRKNQKRWMA